MDVADWAVVAGWLVVLIAVLVAVTSSAQHRRASTKRLARAVGLEVPEQLRPAIEARTGRRDLIWAVGIALGLVGWVLTGQGGVVAAEWPLGPAPLFFIAALLGAAVGSAVAAATERITHPRDAVRLARARAVSVEDYLAPWELHGARIIVALSVVLAGAATVLMVAGALSADIAFMPVPLALIVLAVASLALFEVNARRILDRGRPAGSPLELAWDDALRATALREMVMAPICLGILGGIGLLLAVGNAEPGPLSTGATTAAVVLTLVVLVGHLATAIGGRPRQHYLRRLWPDMVGEDRVRVG